MEEDSNLGVFALGNDLTHDFLLRLGPVIIQPFFVHIIFSILISAKVSSLHRCGSNVGCQNSSEKK